MAIMTTAEPTTESTAGPPSWLPWGRPLTAADLDDSPDDGHRYELIDGVLIVSPAPVIRHQLISTELVVLLHHACPDDLQLFHAPLDVVLAVDTKLQPDLLIARKSDLTERNLPTAPLLAIEILSPSTRRFDLRLKHDRLEEAGCPSYWVVDPGKGAEPPRLIAWELREGRYAEVADVTGDETWTATAPFPVTITPSALLA